MNKVPRISWISAALVHNQSRQNGKGLRGQGSTLTLILAGIEEKQTPWPWINTRPPDFQTFLWA